MVTIKNAIISGASLAALASGHAVGKRAPSGQIITSCTVAGVVALTFDDGPYIYSQEIVDALTAAGHHATFFQNGDNYGDIYSYGPLLTSMIAGGHQIGSHTWSHADLATLDAAGITSEMGQLETAHLALIGKAPTYMRPPYLSTNQLALDTLTTLGYNIISVDIDTQDWAEGPIGEIQLSLDWYEGNQTAGGTLSLNHDVYQPTAETFVPSIIQYLASKGLKSVTVGECLGDAPANWYRGQGTVVSSASASASASAVVSGSVAASALPSSYSSTNGTKPSGTYPSGYPASSGKPGKKPCGGGDTEPGHGPDAGRGALPGHKGSGNDGWTGSYPSNSSAATTGGYAAPSASGVYTGPLSNNANALTGSVLALCGAALLAFLL